MDIPQRRNTTFPGNSPVALGKRPADPDVDTTELSTSKIPKISKTLGEKLRNSPPVGRFPVNPRSNQYSPTSRIAKDHQQNPEREFIHESDPWHGDEYQAILKESDGGTVIAHKQALNQPIIAINEQECSDSQEIGNLSKCSHRNIVSLHEVYFYRKTLFFIYERVDVSLAEVQATPYGGFTAFQITTVYKEILNSIDYIHKELKIAYSPLDASNVMINRDGDIKLANIGKSMLKGVASKAEKERDYRSLGLLMSRLMERSASLEDPDSIKLRRPELWDPQIKDFLERTSDSSGDALRRNDFLDFSPESHWLKPLVLITERMIDRDWEPCLNSGPLGPIHRLVSTTCKRLKWGQVDGLFRWWSRRGN